jgi:DNA mismatch repair protein MutS
MNTRLDQRAFERQLAQEFVAFDLDNWYVQYRWLKASCPDAVLLYRMGDFYETFDDDAKLSAQVLDVTLTYKKFAKTKAAKEEQRCPMAGMPYHAAERYVGQLVSAGYRVAIAEQISETPSSRADTRARSVFAAGLEQTSQMKGMVERKIVRVITPGTVIDSSLLPATQNNYLVALLAEGQRAALAYADLSTGEFAVTEFSGERAHLAAQGELARLQAAEVLTPEDTALRLPGVDPVSARLSADLEFMTKEEREVLLPSERIARRTERESNARWAHGHVTVWPTWRWELRTARDALLQQFNVRSLTGFGVADRSLAARAAGALLQYVNETQNGATNHITALRAYTTGEVMFLDPQTRRNLELLEGSSGRAKGALIGVLDQTKTPMGARMLRRWLTQPLLDLDRLKLRHEAVALLVDQTMLRNAVRDHLKQVGDLERAANRLMQGTTVALPRDLVRLREALRALPALARELQGWLPPDDQRPRIAVPPLEDSSADNDDSLFLAAAPLLQPAHPTPSLREQREARRPVQARYADDDLFGDDALLPEPAPPIPPAARPVANVRPAQPQVAVAPIVVATELDVCADLLSYLEQALDDDPPALLGVSNYLRAAEENGEKPRRVIRPGFEPMIDQIVTANRLAQRYLSNLEQRERERTGIKSLRVDYNKVFGYYIEVSKSYADQVPADYVRRQTLTSGERYVTDELKQVEQTVTQAQEQLADLERQVFNRICEFVAQHGPRLLAVAQTLARLDVYANLAEVAVRNRYVRPTLTNTQRITIQAGRHPVVEQYLAGQFVPNHALLDADQHLLLVTGPNMAGKSTILRQVALIVLLAQIGAFVPADAAEIGLVDRIFTRIGAQDDIATGQSTFMVEMTETAALLQQSTSRSLIILDEVGRGTSTYDGMAIAQAIVEYLHNEPRLGCRTLFATHYHELTELEQVLPRVKNYHMAAVEHEGSVVFLHELRRGGADRSYGLHVAEIAGMPRGVLRRASELLATHEQRRKVEQPAAVELTAPRDQQRVAAAPSNSDQLSLFDLAPNPVVEMLKRLNVNELTPLEALTKLYELHKLAQSA